MAAETIRQLDHNQQTQINMVFAINVLLETTHLRGQRTARGVQVICCLRIMILILCQLQLHMIPGMGGLVMGLYLLLSVFAPQDLPVRMDPLLYAQGVLLVSTKM
jgi:hypothetical protein